MKILVVTNLPSGPVFGGDILRVRKMAQYLSLRNDVTFLCAGGSNVWSEDNINFISVISINFIEKFLNLLSALIRPYLPIQAFLFRNPRIEKYVLKHAHEYDLIVFHLIRCFPYFSKIQHPRVIVDLTDSISMTYYRIKKPSSFKELFFVTERWRLFKLEKSIVKNPFINTIFIGSADASFVGAQNSIIVPNGVDGRSDKSISGEPEFDSVFIGNCRSASNFKALRRLVYNIIPKILNIDQEFTLAVIGFVPEKFKSLFASKNIVFLGNVESLSSVVGKFRIGFAPIDFGAGLQNKVLDYITLSAIPIVSPIAAEGFSDLVPFFEICVTDDEFVSAALRIRDPLSNDKIHHLEELISKNYSWHKQLSKIDCLVA
jgi:glycosyltransferase involved in cell wall biosynthesis